MHIVSIQQMFRNLIPKNGRSDTMGKGNGANLKPFGTGKFTDEEEFAIRSAGGKASAAARKKRKTLKRLAETLLDAKVTDTDTIKILTALGVSEDDRTWQTAIIAAQIMQAAAGNTKAAKFLAETLEETIQAAQLKQRKAEHRHRVDMDKELLALKKQKAEDEAW